MSEHNHEHAPQQRVCSVCGMDYTGDGHHARPINEGRCCDGCYDLVIMHLLRNLARTRLIPILHNPGEEPQ